MSGPVIFKQKRSGKKGKTFTLFKFRTMKINHSGSTVSVKGERRITPLGAWLRKYKIDELPELWNVLKGDMSLVGPRPLLESYLPCYSEREQKRHLVKPGITGLAQISGRNFLNWDERLELDVQYVENHSLILDVKILFKTFRDVFLSKGVAVDSSSVEPSLIDYKLSKTIVKND